MTPVAWKDALAQLRQAELDRRDFTQQLIMLREICLEQAHIIQRYQQAYGKEVPDAPSQEDRSRAYVDESAA